MKLSEVKIYGRPIFDFLLPDQIEIAQKQLDESPAPDGWVRVEDGLPFNTDNVLAYNSRSANENCSVEVCFYDEDWKGAPSYFLDGITHWQHLPQPPKQ